MIWAEFTQVYPASILSAPAIALLMSRVQIEDPRPKMELLACSMAWSRFLTRTMARAGRPGRHLPPRLAGDKTLCRIRHPWVAARHRESLLHASPHLPLVLRLP